MKTMGSSLGASWGLAFLVACGSMSEDDRKPSGPSSSVGSGGSSTGSSGSGGAGGASSATSGQGGNMAAGGGSVAAGGGGIGGGGGNSGGSGGSSGSGGSGGTRDAGGGGTTVEAGVDAAREGGATSNFSFFVVSMKALQMLSGKSDGFGGNLTFGQANGLAGADEICRQAAEMGMPGAGSKTWRAFLSANQGPGGMPVHARDRIGQGPWYDRNGKLLSANLADLFSGARPKGDSMLVNDMTNERGEPNHHVGPGGYDPVMLYDNHDTLTGSDTMGQLRATSMADTCNDWTSATVAGRPWLGHSWPRSATGGLQWASDHQAPGCVPGLDRTLGGTGSGACVGCGGGYGGFFCFAVP
jgi:hypothetical protein